MGILVMTIPEFEENARRIAGDDAVIRIAGKGPLWPVDDLETYRMVIIYLHPGPDGKAWVDSAGHVVLTAARVRVLNLNGAVVFLGTCFGIENTEMLEALFVAGAEAVVAGPGENYGGSGGVLSGADIMAMALRSALQARASVDAAWAIAWMYAGTAVLRGIAGSKDALEFKLIKSDGKVSHGNWKNFRGCMSGVVGLVVLMVMMIIGALSPDLMPFTSPVPTLPESPIGTSTPAPTYTPWWAPIGTEVPWPTPTACISGFGCTPYTGSLGVLYYTYMPNIFYAYGWTWESTLFINGVEAESGASVVYSDSVAMIETVDAGGQRITATLWTEWSASLAYSTTSINNGSIITGPDYTVMVANDTEYGFIGMNVFEVLSGTFTTDVITRTLIVYTDEKITPTTQIYTTTLLHP